jgi:hypothetical protein
VKRVLKKLIDADLPEFRTTPVQTTLYVLREGFDIRPRAKKVLE